MSSPAPAIELRHISKSFGPVRANQDISLSVRPGTLHGIIGENGAGKSTLMSILFGYYQADHGEIWVHGSRRNITDPQGAIAAGIGMVFQHFKLVENFTVLENIMLGAEGGFDLSRARGAAREKLRTLSRAYELDIDPDALIEDISVGARQRVEILKALYRNSDILILDEPTGVLTPAEADQLFRILKNLADAGKTVILITHKLREILTYTDTVSVIRRGQMVAHRETADTSAEELAELMVGRRVVLKVDKTPAQPGDVVLRAQNLSCHAGDGSLRLKNVSFDIRAGEILGIAGVAGNGQSELLHLLGGMHHGTGDLQLNGRPLPVTGRAANGRTRRDAGVAHVPEDRHHEGLILNYMGWENAPFGYHHRPEFSGPLSLRRHNMIDDASQKFNTFDVRPNTTTLEAQNFSGGNQQKIVLAREIQSNPDVLLVGQPTRGVDVGAIEFIYDELIKLRDSGKAILLVSVELDEIFALSDRIIVMCDGEIVGERLPAQTNENELGLMMAGLRTGEAA